MTDDKAYILYGLFQYSYDEEDYVLMRGVFEHRALARVARLATLQEYKVRYPTDYQPKLTIRKIVLNELLSSVTGNPLKYTVD